MHAAPGAKGTQHEGLKADSARDQGHTSGRAPQLAEIFGYWVVNPGKVNNGLEPGKLELAADKAGQLDDKCTPYKDCERLSGMLNDHGDRRVLDLSGACAPINSMCQTMTTAALTRRGSHWSRW